MIHKKNLQDSSNRVIMQFYPIKQPPLGKWIVAT